MFHRKSQKKEISDACKNRNASTMQYVMEEFEKIIERIEKLESK